MSEALSLKNPKKRKIVFADDVQPYLPATLKQWKSGWTLVYYIENPETGIMERRRQRVDYIRYITKTGSSPSPRKWVY
ncbi:hypothetical protein LJC53_07870 [Bacteroidales bacterium OttesenSCG-928-C03]|nr:hypothetical protein [Bacteroidales bacterium OttesenSCG-928-C03]